MSDKPSGLKDKKAELKRLFEIECQFSGIKPDAQEPPFCSFCGKGKDEYKKLVAGPAVNICNECVLKSAELLAIEGYDI